MILKKEIYIPMRNKLLQRAALLPAFLVSKIYAAGAGGLPTINGPSGSSQSDPFVLIIDLIKWGITIIAFGLVAFTFLTVVKNGWQKYHQLGEEGSKTTWRDLASNLVAGALLICLGVAMANYAIDVFGESKV